jgi:hypothetical protein
VRLGSSASLGNFPLSERRLAQAKQGWWIRIRDVSEVCGLAPLGRLCALEHGVESETVLISGAPESALFARDRDDDLIHVPLGALTGSRCWSDRRTPCQSLSHWRSVSWGAQSREPPTPRLAKRKGRGNSAPVADPAGRNDRQALVVKIQHLIPT